MLTFKVKMRKLRNWYNQIHIKSTTPKEKTENKTKQPQHEQMVSRVGNSIPQRWELCKPNFTEFIINLRLKKNIRKWNTPSPLIKIPQWKHRLRSVMIKRVGLSMLYGIPTLALSFHSGQNTYFIYLFGPCIRPLTKSLLLPFPA